MPTFERTTIRLSDGYPCQGVIFRPERSAASGRAVLYLHGIQSHGGWFMRSAAALGLAGHAVLMPDRRGSGSNGRGRGHARSVSQLLDDGRRWLERAGELGDGRVDVLGVSWGGKLAVALAATCPELVASLVLSTPGLYSRKTLGAVKRLAVGAAAAVWPRKTFAIPLNDPQLFTDVAEHAEFIRSDPLRLGRATARFMFCSFLMERRLGEWTRRVRCPVLLLLANRDPIIDNERTENLLRAELRGGLLTVRRFPAAVHTLEFQADPTGYLTALIEWVNRG